MLTYTTYSEAGGVGKTTVGAALLEAHAEHGLDVLAIDMDQQNGSLTYLLDVDAPRDDSQADNIVRHMIDRPKGDLADLIHETEHGFDLLPSHNMLENLEDLLNRAQQMADDLGEGDDFDPYDRLRQVLMDAGIPQEYDVIVVDPPATAGPHLYNAVSATRSLVIPVEPTGKGMQSVIGLEELVEGLEDRLEAEIGVLAAVPNGIGRTTDQERYLNEIHERGYPAPVALRERSSLFEGCWDQQCTPAYYVEEYRDRTRDHEMETLEKIDDLATQVEEVGGL
ncbi:ParA domain protein (plasmid) [Natrialba magadii ATCC 43099]|uniref:ParA domain protein n=1 Tax=Natrialba magadii (strain ATCC 43099 / DSM 3394 / CCM 3739 / CIP 104546 / IAM 13178 / JCM 8861 / NBRC 102185 / NCIMB 2190 / MS3) TaxID=547559 RepID=D3T1G5_NATMM|nr:ParA family protein [Natrialba magadii]ADD07424.1 ParA domain protein [Natrialba magadii ATCC 43099]ELY32233.1 plasmid partitioning protein Soj [Natrialba magadii ATCC 43099]